MEIPRCCVYKLTDFLLGDFQSYSVTHENYLLSRVLTGKHVHERCSQVRRSNALADSVQTSNNRIFKTIRVI